MATMAEQHRQTFEDRLARIKAGGPNCMGTIHYGPGEEIRAADARKAQAAKTQTRATRKRRGSPGATMLLIPVALLAGALSVFTGRVAAYRLFSEDGPYAMELAGVSAIMFADVLIAAALAAIFAWAFRLTWGMRRVALIAGFVAMMVGEFELMQIYPDVFETFFSDTYVAGALANPPATL